MKKLINYLIATYNKKIKGKCKTFFYMNGCNCEDCNLQQDKEFKCFYKRNIE